MNKEKINEIVISTVKSLIETFPEDQQFQVTNNTILFGYKSQIESLSLVSIIVDLETIFFDEYDKEISLTDDRAMTRKISPFTSIDSLVEFIYEIICENN
jgi:acyl carrier protein